MVSDRDIDIDRTDAASNLLRLSKYGVLTARPGYEIKGHRLTGRRAVVATVHTKKPTADLPLGEALPDSIGGVPVDVREANSYQRLRAIDPLAAKITPTYRRPEEAEPEWPLEREISERRTVDERSQRNARETRGSNKGAARRCQNTDRSRPQTSAGI